MNIVPVIYAVACCASALSVMVTSPEGPREKLSSLSVVVILIIFMIACFVHAGIVTKSPGAG